MSTGPKSDPEAPVRPVFDDDLPRDESEWRARLDDERYRVLRQGGTEPPFTGRYWDEKTPGLYRCAACGHALYRSDAKYESGTGWPSFYEAISDGAIRTAPDHSHGMVRTELLCGRCGGHLGHLFDDGPDPTGQRHCINSAALELEPEERGGS